MDHPTRVDPLAGRRELVIASAVFLAAFTLRAWGISTRFQLLGDQIRDWDIALRPLTELPLVGPPTHVHGYTLGPAFYWILWLIRIVIGPWFQNLPHAGGIGQALLQSAADALLLVAIWRRLGSMWVALAIVILEATAAFDLSLSALVWNPLMGSMLAKTATALTLLNWHRQSTLRSAVVFAVAWMAVHAYTGAIYVSVSIFAAALLDPLMSRNRTLLIRNFAVIAAVVFVLQLPYLEYRFSHPGEPAMAAVTGSLGDVLSGRASLRLAESVRGYLKAVDGIEVEPWHFAFTGWVLLACGAIVAIRYRSDPALLLITLMPQLLAIAGYAFFLSGLDNYYYLSLMPAAVMTVVLAMTAVRRRRIGEGIAIAAVILAVVIIPTRRALAMTINQMPEYGAIVHASRTIVSRAMPVRGIRTDFRLPPTNDPEFVFQVLGGKIDRSSPWVATIERSGEVTYRNLGTP